jgi:hypothetical protein
MAIVRAWTKIASAETGLGSSEARKSSVCLMVGEYWNFNYLTQTVAG